MRPAVIVVALLVAAPAGAAESGMAARGIVRSNANAFDSLGFGLGMEAHYQPGIVGLVWTIDFTRNYESSSKATDTYIVIVDAGIAARFHTSLGKRAPGWFVEGQVGADLLRFGDTFGASTQRSFWGPAVGGALGAQEGNLRVSVGLSDEFVVGGINSFSLIVALGVSSR